MEETKGQWYVLRTFSGHENKVKNLIEAESTARKSIYSDPDLIHGYRALAKLGVCFDREDYINEARKQLSIQRPQLIPYLDLEIANNYLDVNDFINADEAFRRCIRGYKKLGKENAEAYLGRSTILVQMGKGIISHPEKSGGFFLSQFGHCYRIVTKKV